MSDSSLSYNVLIVGLGSMGMGAAKSCIAAGLGTHGLDLDIDRCDSLKADGAISAGQHIEDVEKLDAVVLLLVNAAQCKKVLFGDRGLASRLSPGTAIMLSSTMAAHDVKEIATELEKQELLVLDAPVSGGAAKALTGEITVMASGQENAFSALRPVLDAIAAKVYNVGQEIGQGATVKIVHQLLAGVHIAVAAEAMALAARADIPLEVMYDVVTHAAGNSWMFENRMQHVLDGDYSPKSAVDIFVKDLGLVTETGLAMKFPLPLATTAYSMFANASNAGFGKEDDAAVIKTFAGITLP